MECKSLALVKACKFASGDNFSYSEALKPGGFVGAVLVSLATGLAGAAALVPPLRFLIRKVVPKPGQGTETHIVHSTVSVTQKLELTAPFQLVMSPVHHSRQSLMSSDSACQSRQ